MFIRVVLLCQAYFAHLISFRVLITNLCLILKILQKLKASSDDEVADAEAVESVRDEDRANSPSRTEGTHAGHPTNTRSAARKRSSSSQTINNRYVASRL